jgi:glycerol-3-phosphate acyltransferase PlsX
MNSEIIRIAVDAMGGDDGPLATIPAVMFALQAKPDLEVILVGQEAGIKEALGDALSHPCLSIFNAEDTIRMDELPARALRRGKQSSMWKAVDLVAQGEADACVSAGNTGALMAIARHLLKTLPGIDRPAICAALPTRTGHTYMLDLGANISSDSEQLLQFAVMGVALVESLYNKLLPTVSLLNIGSETTKGNEVLQRAAELIKDSGLNYGGFVEGSDLYTGEMDVIVADGFTGNIALKSSEGMAEYMLDLMQQAMNKNIFTRFAALLVGKSLRESVGNIDPRNHNGASLLGLRGLVVKSHGNANAHAFEKAILLARKEVRRQLVPKLELALESAMQKSAQKSLKDS